MDMVQVPDVVELLTDPGFLFINLLLYDENKLLSV